MITVHHSDISQLSHVSILSSPFITFVYLGSQNLVSCDIHIVILSSSDQWHLVETNCNNIFTTRNSWNISRSSKRHSFLTTFPCFSCCLWDHGWLESPGLFTSLLRFFQTDSEVTHYRRQGLHLASHDMMSSRHMTCHHHLPAPSSQSRFQHDQYWPQPCEHLDKLKGFMSPGKLLCKYSANIVSCSHACYLYGRWAPVECDLCEGLSYWSSPFCLNVK